MTDGLFSNREAEDLGLHVEKCGLRYDSLSDRLDRGADKMSALRAEVENIRKDLWKLTGAVILVVVLSKVVEALV